MIKVGDEFSVCLVCLKALSPEAAENDNAARLACTAKGHVMGVATCTKAPPQAWVGKTLLNAGDTVTIHRVDAYGLHGRERHPPVNGAADGEQPTSPVDGKLAYVVEYLGWGSDEGDFEWAKGKGVYDRRPEEVFALAGQAAEKADADLPNPDEKLMITHYYLAVVPSIGVFEFADYELEGYGD